MPEPHSSQTHNAIEIRKATHAEIYTEVKTKEMQVVYGSPAMLEKQHEEIRITDTLKQRLEKDNITLPEVTTLI